MSDYSKYLEHREKLSGTWQSSIPANPSTRACNCVGPRPGEPVCPCRMGSLTVRDGRWVQVIDYGPAPVAGGASE